MENEPTLLQVDLSVDYPNRPHAVQGVSFRMQRGEVLGLVGESGSGKSTIALALLGLLGCKNGRAIGRIVFQGRNLIELSEGEMRRIRGREMSGASEGRRIPATLSVTDQRRPGATCIDRDGSDAHAGAPDC